MNHELFMNLLMDDIKFHRFEKFLESAAAYFIEREKPVPQELIDLPKASDEYEKAKLADLVALKIHNDFVASK